MVKTTPRLCGSLAARPSKFGVKVHNAGYEALDLPFRYVALQVEALEEVVPALRTLDFRGFAVSMPFKQTILRFVDEVSADVAAIGACNTVVNDDGKWTAYNTDWRGFLDALDGAGVRGSGRAVVIGAGGVSRAILYGLKLRGWETRVLARSPGTALPLERAFGVREILDLATKPRVPCDLVVNATPVGEHPGVVDFDLYPGATALMDVVINPPFTPLCRAAAEKGFVVVPGSSMVLHQALHQFRLYTGVEPPRAAMERAVRAVLDGA